MQEIVKVNDKELPVIEWKGQRAITTAQLADIYETDVENVNKNFQRNADKFVDGEHYYLLKGQDLEKVLSTIETYKVRYFYIFTMAKLGIKPNNVDGNM